MPNTTMLRKTLTILSLIGLLLSVVAWGAGLTIACLVFQQPTFASRS